MSCESLLKPRRGRRPSPGRITGLAMALMSLLPGGGTLIGAPQDPTRGGTEISTPVTLEVDPEPIPSLSDGNRVFEPGERVIVAPAWQSGAASPQFLTGDAADFNGPAGPIYTLVVDTADYGEVDPGEVASCQVTDMCYEMDVGPDGVLRPEKHWDAAFDETLSDGTTQRWNLHVGDSFTDVPRASLFYPFVETVLHHEVSSGCGPTEFCPTGINSRGQMPVFVLKALEGPEYTPPACVDGAEEFSDVPFDHPFCPWIDELADRGVVSGCGGGNYCPGDPVTRAQAAVFLLKTAEGPDYTPPDCTGVFEDVVCSSLFAAWIEDLHARQITAGCRSVPMEYCPAEPVSRAQMAVLVSRTFGLALYGPNAQNGTPEVEPATFSLAENSVNGTVVGTVTVTDPDAGQTHTFAITGGNDGGAFALDASSGELTVAASSVLDFETTPSFALTIEVTDDGMPPASGSGTVAVNLTDVNEPPTAIDDSGVTDEDTAAVVDVLANDLDPDAGDTLTIVGIGGTPTGQVTNNGTDVTYDPNGQFESLAAGEIATDTFTYTVEDSGGLPSTATVTVTVTGVNDAPTVVGEIFDVAAGNFDPAIGNTTLQFANTDTVPTPHRFVSGDVLDNDVDPEGDALAITAFDAVSMEGGSVSLDLSTGELTYLPPVGFEGVDSFDYTVSDGTATVAATVSVEVADMVWYVDNDPANDGAGDDGRSTSGFDSIVQFEAENGGGGADDPEAGDIIFFFQGASTYDAGGGDLDGLDLLDQQRLLGEGVDLTVQGVTLVPGDPGSRPSIDNTNAGGDAVTVLADAGDHTGIEIRGLSIDGEDNAIEVTSAGTFQLDVIISDNTFAGAGTEGIDVNPGSSGAFDLTVENNAYSSSPTGHGIDVTTAAGNSAAVEVAINDNTDITSSSGLGINLDGTQGTGTLFVTGFANNTVHGDTGGAGVMVADVTFDADPDDADFDEVAAGTWSVGSSANPVGTSGIYLGTVAMEVEGNLSFTQLDVFAGDGAGLDVAGSGPFTGSSGFQLVVGAGTIEATNGPAVDIDPATIDATFDSLASSGSGSTGISLASVGGSFGAGTVAIDDTSGAGVSITGSSATVALGGGFIGETASTGTTTGGNAVDIDGSSGNVTVAAAVTNTSGRSVEVTNHTGGATIVLSGAIDDNGAGVLLSANGSSGGAAINFTGGLDLATTTNDAFTATGGGTVSVADGATSNTVTTTSGTGVNIADTTIGSTGITFDSVSTSGAASGILLSNTGAGDFAANGGSIANASSRGVDLNGVSGDFTYAGSISTTTAGRSVEVTNHSGGGQTGGTDVAFSGAIDDNGLGIHLDNNDAGTGATVVFSGGLDLDTGTSTAFNATNGGAVAVLDGGVTNDVDTTTGVGVNIANTTIDASGATFTSVSTNGAPNGIVLDTTGTTGSFVVTGDGGPCTAATPTCTGGRLQSSTGADGAVAGSGVYLNDTGPVSLSFMRIGNHPNYAIFGDTVNGFSLIDSLVDGTNGNNAGLDEGAVRFEDLLGSGAITRCDISGGHEDNLRLVNETGTLDRLVITDSSFHDNSNLFGNDGILLESRMSAVMRITVDNSTFSAHRGDHFDGNATDSSLLDVIFTNNIMTGGHPNALGQTFILSNGASADVTFDVSGNSINGAILSAFTFFQSAASTASSSLIGSFNNNTIGTAGSAGSGSTQGNGAVINATGSGTVTVLADNNEIRQWSNAHGLLVQAGDESPTVNVTVSNNTIQEPNLASFPANGLHLNAGTTAAGAATVCLDVQGNDMVGAGALGADDFRLRQRNSSTVNLPGYGGGSGDTAAVVAFVQANNTGTPSGSASVSGSGGGFTGTGASCLTP